MNKLESNEWLVLNSVIYKIHAVENITQMRTLFLEGLKMLLDFDGADFFIADKNGNLCNGVGINSDLSISVNYKPDIANSGKCMVFRESDETEEKERVKSECYKKLYAPNKWHYSVHIILAEKNEFLGIVNLYRTKGKADFDYDDIFMLDMIKEHLAYRLFSSKGKSGKGSNKITVEMAVEKYRLTKREKTILEELLRGKDNTTICSGLVISSNTLKKHILNIYKKLGINNRVQMFKMIDENV